MKRSEINQYIREAKAFMTKYHFMLPPWADWTPDDWKKMCIRDRIYISCSLPGGLGETIDIAVANGKFDLGATNFDLKDATMRCV